MKKCLILLVSLLLFIVSCGGGEDSENDSDEINDETTNDSDTFDGSEVIHFKDVNLEKCVRSVIQKPEGEITVEDVKNVEYLYCTNMGIKYLDGIESLTNVNSLSLPRNDIEDFSVLKGMNYLKILSVYENGNIDFNTLGELIGLEELNIEDCNFETLQSLASLKLLKKLYVSRNNIVSIEEVKNLTGLTQLIAPSNSINSLKGVEKLINLEGLSIVSNNIVSIEEVKNLTGLKSLNVRYNHLQNDDLSVLLNLKNLEKLDVSHNCITDFSIFEEMIAANPDLEVQGDLIEAQDLSRCE